MQFAILFVLAFLLGLILYRWLWNWIPTVLVPMGLFALTTIIDTSAQKAWAFTLIFGLPIVFVVSLLCAYVVQIRQLDPDGLDSDGSE